ncbi:MAG: hypothetical protein GYB42_04815 [Alphaproteobacteria bacterium]|nr:hypothetical protein [Alphaproteobacteria bacterium]
MFRTLLASVAAVGFAGSAFAGTVFTAELESPVTKAEKIVAAKVLWNCEDTTCTAEMSRKTATVRTCKKVVKKIGKVSEFASASGALSAEELEVCNEAAK